MGAAAIDHELRPRRTGEPDRRQTGFRPPRQSMEHRTAEAFGIDLERVRGLFADYTARFAPRSDP